MCLMHLIENISCVRLKNFIVFFFVCLSHNNGMCSVKFPILIHEVSLHDSWNVVCYECRQNYWIHYLWCMFNDKVYSNILALKRIKKKASWM